MKIDPFYVLFLAELSLIFFVLFLFFFSRNTKHKTLYQKTLRMLNDLRSNESAQASESASSEEAATPAARPDRAESHSEQPLPDSVLTESFEDEEESPNKLKRLQRMVNFQKKAMLELMCFKDIFETARGRLDTLRESNYEVQEKVRGLFEGGVEGVGTGEAMTAMEKNNHELEKFIAILDRENATLSGKFRIWEERFERIAVDAIEDPAAGVADDAKYEELLAKVKEAGDKLAEKDKNIEDMKLQYEDIEKEYMILYKQQQQQQQEQPKI